MISCTRHVDVAESVGIEWRRSRRCERQGRIRTPLACQSHTCLLRLSTTTGWQQVTWRLFRLYPSRPVLARTDSRFHILTVFLPGGGFGSATCRSSSILKWRHVRWRAALTKPSSGRLAGPTLRRTVRVRSLKPPQECKRSRADQEVSLELLVLRALNPGLPNLVIVLASVDFGDSVSPSVRAQA